MLLFQLLVCDLEQYDHLCSIGTVLFPQSTMKRRLDLGNKEDDDSASSEESSSSDTESEAEDRAGKLPRKSSEGVFVGFIIDFSLSLTPVNVKQKPFVLHIFSFKESSPPPLLLCTFGFNC